MDHNCFPLETLSNVHTEFGECSGIGTLPSVVFFKKSDCANFVIIAPLFLCIFFLFLVLFGEKGHPSKIWHLELQGR